MIDITRFAELVQRDQRSTAVRDQFLLLVARNGMCAMMSAAGVILSNGGCQPSVGAGRCGISRSMAPTTPATRSRAA